MTRELVIFGGTFDPPHLGHMAVISGLRERLSLPVVAIPNGQPPHREPPVASPEERLHLVRLAVAALGDPLVTVSDVEVRRGGPSYTADTLEELHREVHGVRLLLALGSDAAASLPDWERAQVIAQLARLVVFDRSGTAERATSVIAELREAGYLLPDALAIGVMAPELEASDIRDRLAEGADCSAQLAPPVWREIRRVGLYGAAPDLVSGERGIIAPA